MMPPDASCVHHFYGTGLRALVPRLLDEPHSSTDLQPVEVTRYQAVAVEVDVAAGPVLYEPVVVLGKQQPDQSARLGFVVVLHLSAGDPDLVLQLALGGCEGIA